MLARVVILRAQPHGCQCLPLCCTRLAGAVPAAHLFLLQTDHVLRHLCSADYRWAGCCKTFYGVSPGVAPMVGYLSTGFIGSGVGVSALGTSAEQPVFSAFVLLRMRDHNH